jgi:hypothetical protein
MKISANEKSRRTDLLNEWDFVLDRHDRLFPAVGYSGTKPVARSVPGQRHEKGVLSLGVVASGYKRNSILSEMRDNKGAIIT